MRGVTDARFRCSGEGRRRSATMHIRRTTTAPLSDAAQPRSQAAPPMLEPLQSSVDARPLGGRPLAAPAKTAAGGVSLLPEDASPDRYHQNTSQAAILAGGAFVTCIIAGPVPCGGSRCTTGRGLDRSRLDDNKQRSNDVAGGAMIHPRTAAPLSRNHWPNWGHSEALGLALSPTKSDAGGQSRAEHPAAGAIISGQLWPPYIVVELLHIVRYYGYMQHIGPLQSLGQHPVWSYLLPRYYLVRTLSVALSPLPQASDYRINRGKPSRQ